MLESKSSMQSRLYLYPVVSANEIITLPNSLSPIQAHEKSSKYTQIYGSGAIRRTLKKGTIPERV